MASVGRVSAKGRAQSKAKEDRHDGHERVSRGVDERSGVVGGRRAGEVGSSVDEDHDWQGRGPVRRPESRGWGCFRPSAWGQGRGESANERVDVQEEAVLRLDGRGVGTRLNQRREACSVSPDTFDLPARWRRGSRPILYSPCTTEEREASAAGRGPQAVPSPAPTPDQN